MGPSWAVCLAAVGIGEEDRHAHTAGAVHVCLFACARVCVSHIACVSEMFSMARDY